MTELKNFVGGKSADTRDGRTSDVIDPSTGEAYAQAPISAAEDVDAALRAAAEAFGTWRDATPADRSVALLKIADAVEARADELVDAECRNTGKPVELTMRRSSRRSSTSSGSSPARRGYWRGGPPASTWRTTPHTSGASRSGSAPRSPPGTTR